MINWKKKMTVKVDYTRDDIINMFVKENNNVNEAQITVNDPVSPDITVFYKNIKLNCVTKITVDVNGLLIQLEKENKEYAKNN